VLAFKTPCSRNRLKGTDDTRYNLRESGRNGSEYHARATRAFPVCVVELVD
jgi:hypothetical protein